jgi:adenylate cyclase
VTGGRVLVVDDAAFNRRLLSRLLATIGHETLEAADGQAALDLLATAAGADIDVVLLDIVMPILDGFATLEAMQADERLREIPVIVISDLDDSASIVRCIRMGAADHLPKTVDPEILRARIEASLSRKRLRDLERRSMAEQARLLGTIDRQRAELSRFLSPQVAALVSSADGETLLAGHRREITAMFCDLRQFTVFSDAAEPEEVLGFLRAYHGLMGPLIVAHEGTLEHFAGDGFMTFFNDPVLQPDHALRAVRLAVAMRDAFADLAQTWRLRGYTLELGIGIATGYATLGRIGFEGRYDYGGVGRVIIHAARLSSDAAPTEILIAQGTYAAAADGIDAVPAGERQLKGFSRPLQTYAVQGIRTMEALT